MNKYIPGNQKHLTLEDRKYIEKSLNEPLFAFTQREVANNSIMEVSHKFKMVIYKRGFQDLHFSYMMKGTGLT